MKSASEKMIERAKELARHAYGTDVKRFDRVVAIMTRLKRGYTEKLAALLVDAYDEGLITDDQLHVEGLRLISDMLRVVSRKLVESTKPYETEEERFDRLVESIRWFNDFDPRWPRPDYPSVFIARALVDGQILTPGMRAYVESRGEYGNVFAV